MKITTKGYIQVYRGTEYISRHRVETEAIESAFTQGPGDYTFTYPNKVVEIDGVPIDTVVMDLSTDLTVGWETYEIT